MRLIPLSELFEVTYGVNLELNKMKCSDDGIPFVGRSDRNNGVTAFVKPIDGIEPNPAGSISVAGGGSVLATFLQKNAYYSGRDLFYLVPNIAMSDSVKLYYCACIRANRYRYNYGRQANKTLKNILLPSFENIPEWVFDGVNRGIKNVASQLSLL
ncbi:MULTISPECIES: restriction endonuclease subunit S [Serratia]|uniref:restriction endonuclease subunit S n=1 Tax=Serratia TaxID=613 RepID=UPI000E0ED03C|nr:MULTISPECIES: restriction endonuclease subunit S [Serratia]RDL27769.1 type I restriction modification DNA specificity protein [Serratia fonticola]